MSLPVAQPARGPLRLFGVEIAVDPSWLIFAAFVGWTVFNQYLPELRGFSQSAYLLVAALVVVGLSLSILLHEMAHTFAGRAMGMTVDKITLYMFGGVAHLRYEPHSALAELVMALAGPLLSVALSFGLKAAVIPLNGVAPLPVVLSVDYLADLNMILAVFNMIPAFPMDGGRVLRSLIWMFTRKLGRATRIAATLGQGFGVLLILRGGYYAVTGDVSSGLWSAVLGVMLMRMAGDSRRNAPVDLPAGG
jgi:Zn-dependent protease